MTDVKPVHGAMFITDIESFNRRDRSDLHRARLRSTLQDLLQAGAKECGSQGTKPDVLDLGDGVGLLFPATFAKNLILTKLVPAFESAVKEHNAHEESAATSLRVRAVIHFGDYFRDHPSLSKRGSTGGEINMAFRLLAADELRAALNSQDDEHPVAVLASDDYYKKIIAQQLEVLSHSFAQRNVQTKEGKVKAWLLTYQPMNPNWRNRPIGKRKPAQLQVGRRKDAHRINLGDLTDALIVSTSDIHNYNLYKRVGDAVPLENHLETALLLGRVAVLHCTDPYRSPAVLEMLWEFRQFIKGGKIAFLLGSSIENIRHDFIPYVMRKASQYRESGHGTADIQSLNKPIEESECEKVLEELEMSPLRLHRGYGGTDAFIKAVHEDFAPAEIIATSTTPMISKIRHVNLTLRQILSLYQIDTEGHASNLIADKEQTEQIVCEVGRKINHDSFSRQILLSLMKKILEGRNLNQGYYDLLETRINLLHLRINVGKHAFIEFHPERDKSSPFNYRYLLDHLAALDDRAPKSRFGVELVERLLHLPVWPRFLDRHLRIMAELYARRLADMHAESRDLPLELFSRSKHVDGFAEIASVVKEHWK